MNDGTRVVRLEDRFILKFVRSEVHWTEVPETYEKIPRGAQALCVSSILTWKNMSVTVSILNGENCTVLFNRMYKK